MLYITITENEQSYFDELKSQYPDRVFIRTDHGLDMVTTTQVVIDVAEILEVVLPSILTAISLILMSRANKRQHELEEEEIELKKKEMLEKQKREEKGTFEIAFSSNGEVKILMHCDDMRKVVDNKEQIDLIIKELQKNIESINEQD